VCATRRFYAPKTNSTTLSQVVLWRGWRDMPSRIGATRRTDAFLDSRPSPALPEPISALDFASNSLTPTMMPFMFCPFLRRARRALSLVAKRTWSQFVDSPFSLKSPKLTMSPSRWNSLKTSAFSSLEKPYTVTQCSASESLSTSLTVKALPVLDSIFFFAFSPDPNQAFKASSPGASAAVFSACVFSMALRKNPGVWSSPPPPPPPPPPVSVRVNNGVPLLDTPPITAAGAGVGRSSSLLLFAVAAPAPPKYLFCPLLVRGVDAPPIELSVRYNPPAPPPGESPKFVGDANSNEENLGVPFTAPGVAPACLFRCCVCCCPPRGVHCPYCPAPPGSPPTAATGRSAAPPPGVPNPPPSAAPPPPNIEPPPPFGSALVVPPAGVPKTPPGVDAPVGVPNILRPSRRSIRRSLARSSRGRSLRWIRPSRRPSSSSSSSSCVVVVCRPPKSWFESHFRARPALHTRPRALLGRVRAGGTGDAGESETDGLTPGRWMGGRTRGCTREKRCDEGVKPGRETTDDRWDDRGRERARWERARRRDR